MAVSDGDAAHRRQGHGPRVQRVRRPHPRRAHRPPRHRPHPLLHHRLEHLAQRPAGLPRRRPTTSSPSATTATSPTPRRWPTRPGCCPAPSPATPTSSPSCSAAAPGGRPSGGDLARARCAAVLPRLEGAFSLVLMDDERRHRRPRPRTASGRCASASSTTAGCSPRRRPALDIVGAHVRPRARARRDGRHRRRRPPLGAPVRRRARSTRRLCLFEFVYFARPDTRLYGQSVHQARIRMGEQLAEQAPLPPEGTRRPAMVMGVPESGVPAAEGFARASGIPFGQGLVKNRYIGRSFIAPSQELRARGVRMKLNPLRENIAGKRLVVVDDSIVRGTTQKKRVVTMLREAGAAEVHLRITSPPVGGRASTAWTPATAPSCSRATSTVDEIRELPRRRHPRLPRPRPARGGHRRAGRRLLRRLLHRRLPGRGAGHAAQGRARSRAVDGERRTSDAGVRPRRRPTRRSSASSRQVRSTFRPEVIGDIGGFGGLFAVPGRLPTTRCSCQLHRRRRHQADRPGHRPLRHHRHRPRRHVRRRPRVPGRRAAVLPRLHRRRQARSRPHRAARRGRGRRLPAGRLRPDRRRDGRARRRATRVRPGRLRGRRRRARPRSSPASTSRRATCSSGCRRPGCAPTATRWPARCCSSRPSLDDPAWTVPTQPRRRAAAAVGDLRPGHRRAAPAPSTCTPSPTSPAAACPATSPRVLPPGVRRRRRRGLVGGAARSSARSSGWARSPTTRWRRCSTSASAWSWCVAAADAARAVDVLGDAHVIGEVVAGSGQVVLDRA